MVTDYYLQNRTFDKDRDIECGGKIVVGSDVLPFTKSPYSTSKDLYDLRSRTNPSVWLNQLSSS